MTEIYYDSASGHRLRKINDLPKKGMALYEDLDDGSRVICHKDILDIYPRQRYQRMGFPIKCLPRPEPQFHEIIAHFGKHNVCYQA